MQNKILIKLLVPYIDTSYDIYIPVNKCIGNIIFLLNKAIAELNQNNGINYTFHNLYNQTTGEKYNFTKLIKDTNIRNATTLILI